MFLTFLEQHQKHNVHIHKALFTAPIARTVYSLSRVLWVRNSAGIFLQVSYSKQLILEWIWYYLVNVSFLLKTNHLFPTSTPACV